jgi:chromosomal replication initiator protein
MDLWQRVLSQIEGKVSRRTFETWFRPTRLVGEEDHSLTVGVPDPLFEEWITSNYLPLIRETLTEVGKPDCAVVFRDGSARGPEAVARHLSGHMNVANGSGNGLPAPESLSAVNGALRAPSVNPRFTFENFVVGTSNQFAYAACRAVADSPSTTYNPLYIHGGVGLGKTHLMQAVGNHLAARNPRIRVSYLSAERFMNEMITAIRFKRTQDFRERYRSMDVLLIDDIQFLEGKEGTQEEFFHTFNHLYESQKQIVISSDCPPKDISTLEERLRSRFEWGLLADIQLPEVETKVAILRKKAAESAINLPDDLALFIASRVKSNIRELEGCLTKLIAYASLTDRPLGMELAEECLRDIIVTEEQPLSVDRIQTVVADHFNMKISTLKARSNSRSVTVPRQIAMFLCKDLLDISFPELGKRFGGKHHSTVIHSVRKVRTEMSRDESFRKVVHTLRDGLR